MSPSETNDSAVRFGITRPSTVPAFAVPLPPGEPEPSINQGQLTDSSMEEITIRRMAAGVADRNMRDLAGYKNQTRLYAELRIDKPWPVAPPRFHAQFVQPAKADGSLVGDVLVFANGVPADQKFPLGNWMWIWVDLV